jgi:hypothetical protein
MVMLFRCRTERAGRPACLRRADGDGDGGQHDVEERRGDRDDQRRQEQQGMRPEGRGSIAQGGRDPVGHDGGHDAGGRQFRAVAQAGVPAHPAQGRAPLRGREAGQQVDDRAPALGLSTDV